MVSDTRSEQLRRCDGKDRPLLRKTPRRYEQRGKPRNLARCWELWKGRFPSPISAIGLSALLPVLLMAVGCRTLRPNHQTRSLATARQLSLRGADHLQQGNYSEAGTLFSEALRNNSADERAHWGLGECLWQQGSCQEASSHMARAAELSGNNPDYLVRLGEMCLAEDDLERALEQADKVLAFDRRHAAAWALRGRGLQLGGDLESALECYDLALIHKPNYPDARMAIAEIHQALGQPQRALAAIDQLADQRPTEDIPARAWMLRGQALAALGEKGEAKECLRYAAIRADENETKLLLELAELQYAAGDLPEARICLGRAVRSNPDDPLALRLKEKLDRSFNDFSGQSLPVEQDSNWQLVGQKRPGN